MRAMKVLALSMIGFSMACAPAGGGAGATVDHTADLAAVAKVRDDYSAAWKSGDVPTVLALYTADAQSMGNTQPTATGTAAIEAASKGFFGMATVSEFAITPEKTEISGDLAYDRGTYRMVMTMKSGGPAMTEDGRYLVVMRKQADGSWKLSEEINNLPTAPMPPAPPPKGK